MTSEGDAVFRTRYHAATKLMESGELPGWQALLLIVAPSAELERASVERGGREHRADKRERALAFVAAGASHRQAAIEVGCGRTTVSGWVRDQRERVAALGVAEPRRFSVSSQAA